MRCDWATELGASWGSRLYDAGLDLSGPQPCALVYDEKMIHDRAKEVWSSLPEFNHCFALKACPYEGMLRLLGEHGFGFEAASYQEAFLAGSLFPKSHILYDGPAKTPDEIKKSAAHGWLLSASHLEEAGKISAPCFLRVNPMVGAGTIAATSLSVKGGRFGEPAGELPLELPPQIKGLHAHAGSAGCTIGLLAQSARALADLACAHPQVEWINIGGGLPADGSYAEYAKALKSLVPELFEGRWKVFTEFGRSVCSRSGRAYSRVESARRGIATIHLGADFLLRRAYRPADWACPIKALGHIGEEKNEPAFDQRIAGPLCFAGDELGVVCAPEIKAGDWIEIGACGAYCASMWSRHCSRPMPPVYGLRSDGTLSVWSHGETERDIARLWGMPT